MSGRKSKNLILILEKEDATILNTDSQIEQEIVNFFKKLYGTNEDKRFLMEGVEWTSLKSNWKARLERPFEEEEIHRGVSNLGNLKSPGPNGITNEFLKKAWNIL